MAETLEGVVENLLFSSEETGYAVVKLNCGGETVIAVGKLHSPVPGERLRLKGKRIRHPRFGPQFEVEEYRAEPPGTVEGIERYLSSGLVPGIGEGLAGRIVKAFGKETLEVLDKEPERLAEVEGIGKKRIASLAAAWKQQREIRGIMIFLRSYGVGSALAAKIFKRYGNKSVELVRENPYRLTVDMFGVGFATADKIARSLGSAADSPDRLRAGLIHTLKQSGKEGHAFYPPAVLLEKSQKLLQVPRETIAPALETLSAEGEIILENGGAYLPALLRGERGIANSFLTLAKQPRDHREIDPEKALAWVQDKMEISLAEKQIEALKNALIHKISVITGGPGTGKTTIIRALLLILKRAGLIFIQAAPTGRAAKRMKDAGGWEAKTIHRLLEYSPREGKFLVNRENPLDCHWLILDEVSMIDIPLMHHTLQALPPSASLVLAGDADQLPSVGPGRVLKDIIQSGAASVTELNEIYRQTEGGGIVVNAHRINLGLMPEKEERDDFFFIRRENPEDAAGLIVTLCKERIPRRFGMDPFSDIQVLSPMHRGPAGVGNINRLLQEALNPRPEELTFGDRRYRRGDKVMQIRNNYDKDVFNGDIGRIEEIDPAAKTVTVRYDETTVSYEAAELDEITLAYAVSVHKSQGSEFPGVVIPLLTEHFLLLQRNLLYTAVTRGKRLVVLVGTEKALSIALKNTRTRERYTNLRGRLAGEIE